MGEEGFVTVEEDLAGLSSSRLVSWYEDVFRVYAVEKNGHPLVESVDTFTCGSVWSFQEESDLKVHYGTAGPVRAWKGIEWFGIIELKPADTLLEENFDGLTVNGFGRFEKPNRSSENEFVVDF